MALAYFNDLYTAANGEKMKAMATSNFMKNVLTVFYSHRKAGSAIVLPGSSKHVSEHYKYLQVQ